MGCNRARRKCLGVPVSLFALSGFVVNDPNHAPFGAPWLRGITPARLAVFAACCFLIALPGAAGFLPLASAPWKIWDRFARTFAFATPMFLLVLKTQVWTERSAPGRRITAMVLAVVAGSVAYAALRAGVRVFSGGLKLSDPAVGFLMVAYVSRALVTGGLLAAILEFAARERETALRLHRARLSRSEIERQLVESRLNLLRAQIEPHFLFNSLASVKLLYGKDIREGRELLRHLTGYLRDATSCARRREIRLDDEVALARTFLGIFQVRMGKRLLVGIDVPPELESALVPPLTIGTLVENAVKHGIGPRASGGVVRLTARRHAGFLVVHVHDDGVGFRARSGSGVGLGNIRARLETLFGAAGTLDVATNDSGGVTATLRLPYRVAGA